MELTNVIAALLLSAILVVAFLKLSVRLMSEQTICQKIVDQWQRTGASPIAVVERLVDLNQHGDPVYKYEDYRALSLIYDDIVNIFLTYRGRQVNLEVFEDYLAENGMAFSPSEFGAVIIRI